MMFMSAVAAGLLVFASAGGGDTPIEPVDSALVQLFLASPDAESLCINIGTISDQVDTLGELMGSDASLVFEMAAAYWQDMAESGVGPNAAMTAEGEDLFRSWVYDCGGRAEPAATSGFAGHVDRGLLERFAPLSVSGCWLSSQTSYNPDRVYLTCTGGYGWTQIEGYCYRYTDDLHHFSSTWVYKQPGQTLRYWVACSSSYPLLYSAWIDYTQP